MIKSMTGFGKASKTHNGRTVTVELRSLNSKTFDLNMRTPWAYKEKEIELRNLLMQSLSRGKVDLFIEIDASANGRSYTINRNLVKSFHKQLKSLSREFGGGSDLLALILRMPDVVTPEKDKPGEKEWLVIKQLTEQCIAKVERYRIAEGGSLKSDFAPRIKAIMKMAGQTSRWDKERIDGTRKRLLKNLENYTGRQGVDMDRLEQELTYYLEKFDITEEVTRLKTNCEYFLKECGNKHELSGKKLGFISQEIGREINTLGSKANHAELQKLVVEMKDELEKVKEQLNNIL